MPRIWNGKNLDDGTPELGLRPEFASLVPDFADQLLMSGYCADTEHTLFTPLDDLKAWLRTQNPGESGLLHDIRELLLTQEDIDRAKAEAAGTRFDLVDYEITQMATDATYEQFNAEWAKSILALVVEEADSIQAWAKTELELNFSISMSFQLADPRRNSLLSPADIEASLRKYGADDKLIGRIFKGQGKHPEYSGMLLLELSPRGEGKPPKAAGPTAFVSVALVDKRAGDLCDATLSLGYPKELEGYFLLTFDALRQQLTLKEDE